MLIHLITGGQMEGIAQYDFAARRHQASTLALAVGFQAFFLRPICMSQAFNFPKLSTVTPARMPSSCKGIPDAQLTGGHLTLCKKKARQEGWYCRHIAKLPISLTLLGDSNLDKTKPSCVMLSYIYIYMYIYDIYIYIYVYMYMRIVKISPYPDYSCIALQPKFQQKNRWAESQKKHVKTCLDS